ncbi:MAG: hypothetical protein HKL90_00360 [Elusimicrobia bacterium]|nr:hypothetical protein [Elusimicrobiota bacterium]
MSEHRAASASADELQNRAAFLRRAVNASRARLDEQNRRAEALRRELADLRRRAACAAKEAVSDSARVGAAPLAAESRGRACSVWGFTALGLGAFVLAALAAARKPAAAPPEPPASAEISSAAAPLPALPVLATTRSDEFLPTDDDEAAQALLLAARWQAPEDGQTLDERLGPPVDLPGAPPAWSAERTGARSYVVRRRGPAGEVDELRVDLALGSVEPSPGTRRRLSPPLVTRR